LNNHYSSDEKAHAVELIFSAHKNVPEVSELLKIPAGTLYDELRRIDRLQEYQTMFPNQDKRKYTTAQREAAINAVMIENKSIATVAIEYSVVPSTLSLWLKEKGYSVRERQIQGMNNKALNKPRYRQTKSLHGDQRRDKDLSLSWVSIEHPEIEHWRKYAIEWIRGEVHAIDTRLNALRIFLYRYLVLLKLPTDFPTFFSVKTTLPDFYSSVCMNSYAGIRNNNIIHDFLNYVVLKEFSSNNERNTHTIGSKFWNPVSRRLNPRTMGLSESVRTPLPYGYIEQLREMLAQGPNFKDWTWAHTALGSAIGEVGMCTSSWFPVKLSDIDENDPDCVWRFRETTIGPRLEMWSPVRWVALMVKLLLPLRSHQVRLLDSGEADTYRYNGEAWVENRSPLALNNKSTSISQGVFRKLGTSFDDNSQKIGLYINTNKTADLTRYDNERGYVMPWPRLHGVQHDVYYWLLKLRDWQEKYNPIHALVSWNELSGKQIPTKSEIQSASYPDSAFLFRDPEAEGNTDKPITNAMLDVSWKTMLFDFQNRLQDRGEFHPNGDKINLISHDLKHTLFPLHNLRVSLVTAFALEGQVPFGILQKLVGHSRLIMTLYYTKPSASQYQEAILNATKILEEKKVATIQDFLLNTDRTKIINEAIANNAESITVAIPNATSSRNAAGWAMMHHGLCLVGGIVIEDNEKKGLGGCYNGGPNVGTELSPKYLPVPGGNGNCVRCRWFITQPEYLDALVATFNNIAYSFDEVRNKCLDLDRTIQDYRREQYKCEKEEMVFHNLQDLRQAERSRESQLAIFNEMAESLAACYRLIERCKVRLRTVSAKAGEIIAVGGALDVEVMVNEVESELLQLSGVCEDVEIFPDLSAGKAILRRSQILDRFLYRQGNRPFFMILSEEEQMLLGNRFIECLAKKNPSTNKIRAKLEVISALENDIDFGLTFGIDVNEVAQEAIQSVGIRLTNGPSQLSSNGEINAN
jgi:transposase-like protein